MPCFPRDNSQRRRLLFFRLAPSALIAPALALAGWSRSVEGQDGASAAAAAPVTTRAVIQLPSRESMAAAENAARTRSTSRPMAMADWAAAPDSMPAFSLPRVVWSGNDRAPAASAAAPGPWTLPPAAEATAPQPTPPLPAPTPTPAPDGAEAVPVARVQGGARAQGGGRPGERGNRGQAAARPGDDQARPADEARPADGEARPLGEGAAEGGELRPPRPPRPSEYGARPGASSDSEYASLVATLTARPVEKRGVFYYQCKHIRASTMKSILNEFVRGSGTVADGGETDMVIVSDTEDQLEMLKQICEQVDQRIPQILVEAQIIEIKLTDDFEKEFNWLFNHFSQDGTGFVQEIFAGLQATGNTPPIFDGSGRLANANYGGYFNVQPWFRNYGAGKANTLNTVFRFLETRGKAKILSSPNIVLRRNVTGQIFTGEDLPVVSQDNSGGTVTTSTQFKEVGIKLDVTPIMINGDTVRLSVSPEVSSQAGTMVSGGAANPIISRRNAKTELEMKDGQLLAIGGLLSEEEVVETRRVPLFGSIPGLGTLFRGTNKRTIKKQLVIFLTVRVLDENTPGQVTIFRPDDMPPPVIAENQRLDDWSKRPESNFRHDVNRFKDEWKDL